MPQVPQPTLSTDPAAWHLPASASGTSRQLLFDSTHSSWTVTPPSPVQWTSPSLSDDLYLYAYPNGTYGLYQKHITQGREGLKIQTGIQCAKAGHFKRLVVEYGLNRWVQSITLEEYGAQG